MPAILDSPDDIDTWLSPLTFDDKVRALVKPYEGKLECYPVDKGVGKVGNDSKDFIKVSFPFSIPLPIYMKTDFRLAQM